jgi:translation initiation factor IF-3
VPEVRVIDSEGEQLGILPISEALAIAQERGLDLVEVAPNAEPPVCKVMDYGKYKYEQAKRQQEAKKKQTTIQVKEVKVRPKIEEHDLNYKMNNIRKFLSQRNKIKVSMIFRGREIAHTDLGYDLLKRIANELEDEVQVEQSPRLEGRNMSMILAPK